MLRHWRIYMYTFPNGKKYVGATVQTLALRQGKNWQRYKGCSKLLDAIQEFGAENIKQEILFEGDITPERASEIEQKFITLHQTLNPDYGYNTCHGGEGLTKQLSEGRRESLKKQMAEISKKNKGRFVSEETREKQRVAKLGKKRGAMSQETKDKISKANSIENISPETRKKKSESHQKKVEVFDPETKETLVFDSISEAAVFYGVKDSAVSRWISGTRKPKNKKIYRLLTNND